MVFVNHIVDCQSPFVIFFLLLCTFYRKLKHRPYNRAMSNRIAFVWDYDIDEAQFRALLSGELTMGRLNRDWAAIRLLEYGAYAEIVRLLGFDALVQGWPSWRNRIRSETRQRGFDFLVAWLPQHHPELTEVMETEYV